MPCCEQHELGVLQALIIPFSLYFGTLLIVSMSYNTQTFTKISTACVSCHLSDYNIQPNPPHASINIPTTCADCHTHKPGMETRDIQSRCSIFPGFYSGRHNGVWSTFAKTAIANPSNYQVFSCINCHTHNQKEKKTDSRHRDVTGYSYTSAACYQCHPTGGGGGKMSNPGKIKKTELIFFK